MKNNKYVDTLANKLRNVPIIRFFFRSLFRFLYTSRINKSKQQAIAANGLALLSVVDELFRKNNIPYTLAFGTMLGAVREKGFIKHDMDIDVAVPSSVDYNEIQDILKTHGFILVRHIEVDGGDFACEETYVYLNIRIDFFFFYKDEKGNTYTTVFYPFDGLTWDQSKEEKGGVLPMQVWLPLSFEKPQYVKFENIELPIPENAMDFIVARYGQNWRIPDPTFVYPNPGCSKYSYRTDKVGKVLLELDI